MKRKFTYILLALAIAAFAVRLAVSIELAGFNNGFNQVTYPSSATDMAVYQGLAAKIVNGTFKEVFYFQPFYYAFFLPFIKLTFGDSVWALIVIQSILGALTVFLTGQCAALLWNRAAGIIAATLTMLSAALILYTPFMLIETLQVFWIMLLLYLSLLAISTRNWFYWAPAALVCGCSILTRGNVWCFVPGLLAAVFMVTGGKPGPNRSKSRLALLKIAAVVLFLFLILLPQIPFAWRNTILNGKLTGPSTAAGSVLALGNTPEAPPGGRNPDLTSGPMEYPPSYQAWMSTANEISIPARIMAWIAAEPFAYAEFTFRKLLLFWDYQEIPNNISFLGEGTQSKIFMFTGIMPTGLIMAVGLAGMIFLSVGMFRKKSIKLFLLIYFILSFWGATAIFYILCRFRLPVIPLLAICAAVLINHFWRQRSKNPGKAYISTFPTLIIGVFICFTAYDYYRQCLESSIIRIVRPNGVSVEVSPGKLMFLDNGPFSFGGWAATELQSGTTIQKRFPVAGRKFKTAELEFTLFFEVAGNAVLEINGEKKNFSNSQKGAKTETFNIPFNDDGSVNIKLISSNTKVFCLIDHQRNYSRTLINGENPGGELVCRLFCMPLKPTAKTTEEMPPPDTVALR